MSKRRMRQASWRLGIIVCALIAPALAQAGPCTYIELMFVSFRADESGYYSDTRATCYNSYMWKYNGEFEARAWVTDESTGITVGEDECEDCSMNAHQVWVGAVGGTTTRGTCYRGHLSARSITYNNEIGSGQQCVPHGDDDCYDANHDGICSPDEEYPCSDLNYNGMCDEREDIDKDPNEDTCPGGPPCESPILVNLAHGPWRLSDLSDPVDFDIDADGVANRITWTGRDTALAFLALDRNGNGRVDDGSELFGNWTRLASGRRAANGFEALQELDSNRDGRVSSRDARWTALLLWTDANHDGVSQAAEMRSISTSPIEALATEHHWTGRRDSSGNYFGYEALARVAGASRPFYDVYFRSARELLSQR